MRLKKMKLYFIGYIVLTVPALSLFVNADLSEKPIDGPSVIMHEVNQAPVTAVTPAAPAKVEKAVVPQAVPVQTPAPALAKPAESKSTSSAVVAAPVPTPTPVVADQTAEEKLRRKEVAELCDQANKGNREAIAALTEESDLGNIIELTQADIDGLNENADLIEYNRKLNGYSELASTIDSTDAESMILPSSSFSRFCKEGAKETRKECAKILDTLAEHVAGLDDLSREEKLALQRRILQKRLAFLKDDKTMQKLASIVLEHDRLLALNGNLEKAERDLADFWNDNNHYFLDHPSSQSAELRRMLGIPNYGRYMSDVFGAPGLEQLVIQQARQEQIRTIKEIYANAGINPASINDRGIITSSPGPDWRFVPGSAGPLAQQSFGLPQSMLSPLAASGSPYAQMSIPAPYLSSGGLPYNQMAASAMLSPGMLPYASSAVLPYGMIAAPRETNGWDFGIAALGVGGGLALGVTNDIFAYKIAQQNGNNYQNYLGAAGPAHYPLFPPRFWN